MRCFFWLLTTIVALLGRQSQAAQEANAPPRLEEIRIDQRLGGQVPLDATFHDETGNNVTVGSRLGGKPVILALVYFRCPMLCTVTLNQLGRSLNAMQESVGDEFRVVTVSIDPHETPALASDKKLTYLRAYRRPAASGGWDFLTGDAGEIARLTDAVGFRYRWDEQSKAFMHASALVVLTPEGRVSRYFLGVDYPPTELASALQAAAKGVIGSPAEAVYFYCVKYDPASGRYGLIINRALRVLAGLSVVGVGILIITLHRFTRRREGQLNIAA